jgi:FkbM family methyltransferase
MAEPQGGTIRRVSIAGRRYSLTGDPGDSYFQAVSRHAKGVWAMHSVAAAVLPPDGVAVDVGANIGLTALALAALLPEGRVIAAEPSPRTLRALRQNLAANRLGERIIIEAAAVGAEPGEAEFHDSDHSAGSHLLSAGTMRAERLGRVTVPVTTLDRIAAAHGLHRLDLVKVDVEGFESEVLDGAAAAIARYRPAFILEFNAWTILCNRNRNPREVLEDWLARFPVVHAIRGTAPPERVTPDDALPFLHDHLVQRRCMDDLVLGFDADWVTRWQPPPGAGRR